MERRKYVAVLGTVGAVSVSGCLGENNPISSVFGDDPEDAVSEYATAWEEGNRERIDDIIHSDSPWREDEWWLDDNRSVGPQEGVEWEIEEYEITEESESEVTVRETSVWDYPERDPERLTFDWNLRTEDDAWKIWDTETVDTETLDETPDSLS